MDIFPPQDETHPFSHSNTLEARLASALETMSLRETGPQLKFPSVGGKGDDIISTFAHFFSSAGCVNHARSHYSHSDLPGKKRNALIN